MANAQHSKQTVSDGIHIIQSYEYTTSSERTGATGFSTADIGKVARQTDNESFWILTNDSPVTWLQIGTVVHTHTHASTTDQTEDDHHTKLHSSSHGPAGTDQLKLDDLAIPDDNTDLDATESSHGLLPKLGGGTINYLRADGTWAEPPRDSGEVNTASNVGAAGVGVYKTKIGVDLQFKTINAASSKISITDDTVNDEIDIDIVPGNVSHQDLNGSGTNTHTQLDSHVAASSPHSGHESTSSKNSANGYAGLDGSTKLNGSQQTYGTIADTACQGNDLRLSDARTPTSHASTHNIDGSDPVGPIMEKACHFDHFTHIYQSTNDYFEDNYGTGSDVVMFDAVGGQIRLVAGALAGYYATLYSSRKNYSLSNNVEFKLRCKLLQTSNNTLHIGLYDSGNDHVEFTNDVTYFRTKTKSGGISTYNTTDIALDTSWHILKFITSSSDVKFYIDDVLKSTHTTNLTSESMYYRIQIVSEESLEKEIRLDWIYVLSDLES